MWSHMVEVQTCSTADSQGTLAGLLNFISCSYLICKTETTVAALMSPRACFEGQMRQRL